MHRLASAAYDAVEDRPGIETVVRIGVGDDVMPNLTFYRQRRIDGGTRTGIDVDGDLVCGRFDEGASDDNPRLLWFVDLRCDGRALPRTARAAKSWLLKHSQTIKDGFSRFAEEISAGIDVDAYPLMWNDFANVPDGVQMKIVLTAIRRVDARQMADVLRESGSTWEELVGGLKPVHEARRR